MINFREVIIEMAKNGRLFNPIDKEKEKEIEKWINQIEKENDEFDANMKIWNKLREIFKNAKKEKDYNKIIEIGKTIIDFDSYAKDIGVFTPLFEKDIADAYLKLGQKDEAIVHFQSAIKGYKADQKERAGKWKQNGTWQKDIDRLEAKVQKLFS
ncbi:MAG: hypothetical protein LBH43_01620 [Treponema sp.]|jgi:tetratricopeptide (TPR) repeat protein|nr:hypothetical protein [Treponema sp.]